LDATISHSFGENSCHTILKNVVIAFYDLSSKDQRYLCRIKHHCLLCERCPKWEVIIPANAMQVMLWGESREAM